MISIACFKKYLLVQALNMCFDLFMRFRFSYFMRFRIASDFLAITKIVVSQT